MKVKISETIDLSNRLLKKSGFSEEESNLITDTLIDAELCGRKTHGLMRLISLKKNAEEGNINTKEEKLEIERETPVSLLVNGKNKPGFYVINKALNFGIEKAKKIGLVAVGCTNVSPASGMIGHYARIATENNLIFIGFNNSNGGLIPHGAIKELWGTNPLTIGVPSNGLPVILDLSSSQIPYGKVVLAKAVNEKLPEGVALDSGGNVTLDPLAVMSGGGLLPFAGYKGSGIAFIVELLGGALTKSVVGKKTKGGWGSFFILIDPSIFRDLGEFKNEVSIAIEELKNLPKAKGVNEILYPGERSQKLRQEQLKSGLVDVSDSLYNQLKTI